jgi:hypothetical protein
VMMTDLQDYYHSMLRAVNLKSQLHENPLESSDFICILSEIQKERDKNQPVVRSKTHTKESTETEESEDPDLDYETLKWDQILKLTEDTTYE